MLSEAQQTPDGLWQLFLHAVEDKLSAHVLPTWLRPIHCSKFDGKTATLEVRDQFMRDWLADHYLDFIRNGLTEVARTPVEICWVINPALALPETQPEPPDEDNEEAGFAAAPADDEAAGALDGVSEQDGQADGLAQRLVGARVGRGAAQADGEQARSHHVHPRSQRTTGRDTTQLAAGDGDDLPGHVPAQRRGASKKSRSKAAGATAGGATAAPGLALREASGMSLVGAGKAPLKKGTGGAQAALAGAQGPAATGDDPHQLNKRYVFDNFVQGPSNQFAFAACRAAAQNPGRSYNPLFIYGGVGLGKTHLLSAIGHHILANKRNAQIIYTSSEQFTNEVINAVLSGRLSEFRAKYLNHGDAILVDDIQLIAGKERTQHEFFHIFNTLYDSQRQIVVTSDKLPHEIPDIEERLRNRFQWGLIADVQPPEIETRIAILRKKAEVEHFELNNDVAFFLARSIRSNVRELEGALVRIMAHASLTNTQVTVDYARATLGDILQNAPREVSIESIQKTVATYFAIRVSELKGSRRQKQLVRARQMAMYLCRKHLGCSYPELGSRFGDKDHTTVLASCSRVMGALGTDVNMRLQLDEIEQRMSLEQLN